MMMMTTLPYFLIQVPALFLSGDRETVSEGEKYWAMAGFFVCVAFFVYYMHCQLKMSNDGADKIKRMAVIKESLKKGQISLSGALSETVDHMVDDYRKTLMDGANETSRLTSFDVNGDGGLPSPDIEEYLRGILAESFHMYDQDKSGSLGKKEFGLFLKDFHETISEEQLDGVFGKFDIDQNGSIDLHEFICACYIIIRQPDHGNTTEISRSILNSDGDDDEEEEEIPDDLTSLSPSEQQRIIKRRAFSMLFIGTALVLMFSDPMVDVLSEVAVRLNIPAFYVSFILAPLASNASEVIASQYYAAKKTRKTITVALTALEGAASMNNTFCLSIFMALIYFRGLAWQYSAETIAIILVQFGMGVVAMREKMSCTTGMIVLAVFPFSVMFVALLEYWGLD